MKTVTLLLALSMTSAWAGASKKPPAPVPPASTQPLVETKIEDVINTGSSTGSRTPVWLAPGLYESGESGRSVSWTHYWLIDSYANDPSQIIAISFERGATSSSSVSSAQIFHGRRIKGQSSLMLSPLYLDNAGNLRILSESTRGQGGQGVPVLEITAHPGDTRRPYLIRGRNGALGGAHWALRPSSRSQPVLQAVPDNGRFVSADRKKVNAVFVNNELSLSDQGATDGTYTLISLNGSGGKFMGLVKSRLDTMAEEEIALEQIQGLTVFITRCFDQDVLLHFRPTHEFGRYQMSFFRQAPRSFVEGFVWPQ